MLFFDRSLRTRVSFEVAMDQLGGHCMNIIADRELYDLESHEQVVMDGRAEEHVVDAARTLSRYVDALGVRQISQTGSWERDRQDSLIRAYASHASVPVINLETVQEHPCQAIADVLTMRENLGALAGRKLTLAWSITSMLAYTLLRARTGAFIYSAGVAYDVFGMYFLFRCWLFCNSF